VQFEDSVIAEKIQFLKTTNKNDPHHGGIGNSRGEGGQRPRKQGDGGLDD